MSLKCYQIIRYIKVIKITKLWHLFKDTGVDLWRRERLQAVLYKAVKHEDVEMAAKCLKMGPVDVNTRYEPVRSFIIQSAYIIIKLS